MKNIEKKGRKGYRIAAMACVLILAVSAAVTVWADTQNPRTITSLEPDSNTSSQSVTGRYTPGKSSYNGTVVAYDIIWGMLEFNYEESGTGIWNPATHEYDYSFDTKGWSPAAPDSNKITVINRSNTDIKMNVQFTPAQGHYDIKAKFTEQDQETEKFSDIRLDSAAKTNQPVMDSWFLQIVDGVLTKDEKIGSITISERPSY